MSLGEAPGPCQDQGEGERAGAGAGAGAGVGCSGLLAGGEEEGDEGAPRRAEGREGELLGHRDAQLQRSELRLLGGEGEGVGG